jgi:hypothetical protein
VLWRDALRIHYALWPAGYWRGPVRELSVAVELGAKAPLASMSRTSDPRLRKMHSTPP